MKNFILIASIIFAGLLISSCSDIREDLPESPELSTHGEGFTNPNSPNFHAFAFAGTDSLTFNDCRQCHAADFSGGTAKSSCTNCHVSITVHKEGINNPNSQDFHGKFISMQLGWQINDCKICHSQNYAGGLVAPSCLSCHTNEGGPKACNTCHGVFSDPSKIAPPTALNGALLSSDRGVGAHNKHLFENTMGVTIECSECHTVPTDSEDPTHIDNTPGAELVFGDFTKLNTNVVGGFNYQPSLGDFIPDPSFNYNAGTCSNTYCHGYFKNGNLNNVVSFTAQSQGSACGTCHGDPTTGNPLPKTVAKGGTHPPNEDCGTCHGEVVVVNGGVYTFIDKTKHINGKLNIFNEEHVY